MDDFGIKYVGEEHAAHLISALKETYGLEVNTEGENYVGISLNWDYVKGEVHLSMPGYVSEALSRFKHIWSGKPEDQPYAHVVPNCGAKVQYAPDDDTSRPATKEEKFLSNRLLGIFCITVMPLMVLC